MRNCAPFSIWADCTFPSFSNPWSNHLPTLFTLCHCSSFFDCVSKGFTAVLWCPLPNCLAVNADLSLFISSICRNPKPIVSVQLKFLTTSWTWSISNILRWTIALDSFIIYNFSIVLFALSILVFLPPFFNNCRQTFLFILA